MRRNIPAEEPIAVIKIGGSILRGARAYRRAAVFVRNRNRVAPGEKLVVVVSAQEGATDRLERTARKIVHDADVTALDLLWCTGELRSVALLVLQLQALGVSAAGLSIHEAGLRVQSDAGSAALDAKRVRVNPEWIHKALEEHSVAVVPGFFATNARNRIVSLGRGGSDLTAVLLAAGLQARRCELLKDVPGYFTSDPHRDPAARQIPSLTFEEALALADGGCDLVQREAIEAAGRFQLPLVIRALDESAPLSRITDVEMNTGWADPIASGAVAS
ncbi:MAG: hypothetical protein ACRD5M_02115 [Candidatus Acidiferrales bacterium]